jgi:hypothetical protein
VTPTLRSAFVARLAHVLVRADLAVFVQLVDALREAHGREETEELLSDAAALALTETTVPAARIVARIKLV